MNTVPHRIEPPEDGLVAWRPLTGRPASVVPPAHPAPHHGALVRHRLSLIPLLLAMFVALAGVPATASADYKRVFTDCNDGTLDGSYTAKELQEAMRNLDAFTGDYSECSDAIVQAQQDQAGGTRGGSKGSGTTSGSGSGAGATGGSTGTPGGAAGTTGTTTTPPSGADGTTAAPATPVPTDDARNADAAEKAAALAAATASADEKAGKQAAELKNTGVPAAALEFGNAETTLPGPLLLTLVACALVACAAGAATGFQALRRRRGR